MMTMDQRPIEKLLPGLLIVVVLMAFAMGVMWQKINGLQGGAGATTTTTAAQPAVAQAAAVTTEQIKEAFEKTTIKFGKADSKLVFLEIGDPSCPYCHVAGGADPEINKQMGTQFTLKADGGTYVAPVTEMKKLVDSGKAAFAYIYYPGHGNGEMAMKAMYCAQDMGKFWPVHDLLMSNAGYELQNTTVLNDKTKSQVVADFLKSAANSSQMKSCLDSGKYDSVLTAEAALATNLGVTGTPGFFINTTRFAGAYSWTDMQPAADAALK